MLGVERALCCSRGVNYPIRSIFHYAVSLCVVVSPYMCCDVSVEHQTLPVSIFFPWERQIKRIDSVMD